MPNSFNIDANRTVIGKSEARQKFLPIVKAMINGSGPVEIADRGQSVAVIISKQEYDWLKAQTKHKPQPKRSLLGSIVVLGDLEEGSREIARNIKNSIEKKGQTIVKVFISDTHPLINYFSQSKKLPQKVRKVFEQALNGQIIIWVPVVVLWELSLLEKAGKIRLTRSFESFTADLFSPHIKLLDISYQDILRAHSLDFSKDPFDTLLVAMAQRIDCPLITGDTLIHAKQPCRLFWD